MFFVTNVSDLEKLVWLSSISANLFLLSTIKDINKKMSSKSIFLIDLLGNFSYYGPDFKLNETLI